MSNLRIHLALISAISLSWALPTQADAVTEWNAVTANCSVNRIGPSGLFDIALVQTAAHDAVQAIQGRFEAYEYENPALWGLARRQRRRRRRPIARSWASTEPVTPVLPP